MGGKKKLTVTFIFFLELLINVCGCRHVALSCGCAAILNFVSFMCGKGLRSERERKCRMVEEHRRLL